MKVYLSILIVLLVSISVNAQDNLIYLDKTITNKDFRINGLLFKSSKEEVIKKLGSPSKVFEPHYECGAFSDYGEVKNYALKYENFQFIGNDTNKYRLEELNFNSETNVEITYKGRLLSDQTTKQDFAAIFKVTFTSEVVGFYYQGCDCSLIFEFVNGRLSKMHFWSQC